MKSAWRLHAGALALVGAALLEIAGIGAIIVGIIATALGWSGARSGPAHGHPGLLIFIGLFFFAVGLPALLVGFLARRWLTPRVHRDHGL